MSAITAWSITNPSQATASLMGAGPEATTMLAEKHHTEHRGVHGGEAADKAEKVSVTVPTVTTVTSVKMPSASTDMLAVYFLKKGASMSPKVF